MSGNMDKAYGQLYRALHLSNLKSVRHLVLNEGLAVNHQFKDGSFPLHIAAEKGDVEILKLLLSLAGNPDLRNQHGQTALLLGITHPDIVRALIARGCKVNIPDSQVRSALHLACSQGLYETASDLIAAGAKVNAQDRWVRTPLLVTLLNFSHNRAPPEGHVKVIRLLLSHGSDASRRDVHGSTPLFIAAACGDTCTAIVELLICRGANIDQRSQHKMTALMVAVMKNYGGVAKVLLRHNCDTNCFSPAKKTTCLKLAVTRGHLSLAKMLVTSGCQLHREDWLYSIPTKAMSPELQAFIEQLREAPQSLKQLTRSIIRKHYHGKKLSMKLPKMVYPQPLKDYLMLRSVLNVDLSPQLG